MPVPKASRILIQTMANGYLQQLYALQTQLRQQNRHAAKCSTGRRASPAAATVSQCPA